MPAKTIPEQIQELSQFNLQDQYRYEGLNVALSAVRKEMFALENNVKERSKTISNLIEQDEKKPEDTEKGTKPIPTETVAKDKTAK